MSFFRGLQQRLRLNTRRKVALASLLARSVVMLRGAAGRGPEVQVQRRGIDWRLDLREGIEFAIWLLGSFEPGTRRAYSELVRPGDRVVDVGANIGAHTLPFAELVGEAGHVLALEPTTYAYRRLLANLSLNPGLETRVLAKQAVAVAGPDETVPGTLHASWPLTTSEGVHPRLRARELSTAGAEAQTLDRLVEEAGFDRVDLVKVDVDGSESEVLAGADAILTEHQPTLVLEISPYIHAERGASIDALLALLRSHGYRVLDLGTRRPLPDDFGALRQLVPEGGSVNALAVPSRN